MNNNLTKLLRNMFSKQNSSSCKQTILESYAQRRELSENASANLKDNITRLEEKGFQLQELGNDLIVSNGSIKFKVDTAATAQEVFCDELYKIPPSLLDRHKTYCVLDIGANRGYSALYFAAQKWVRRIDAFEIIPRTFNFALENFALNKKDIKKKINIYEYGLGNDTEEIKAFTVPDRDDISTVSQKWLQSCCPHLAAAAQPVNVQLVQASFCLKDLMEHREISNIILKIDVNGAEHEILQELADNFPKIFEEIKIITGKTYSELDTILKILAPFNFKLVSTQPKKNGYCSFLLHKQNNND